MAMNEKPKCPLIGADGNIFNLLGMASRTLSENGLKEQARKCKAELQPPEVIPRLWTFLVGMWKSALPRK